MLYKFFLPLVSFFCLTLLTGCKKPLPGKRLKQEGRNEEIALPTKGIKQTSLEEALLCKKYYTIHKDLDLVAKYLERALTLAKDHMLRGSITLELADTYLKLESRDKACKLYNQFKVLYPGSPKLKYALVQEMIAKDLDSLESSKDQTKTKELVKLVEQFNRDYPNDQDYGTKVDALGKKAYFKLLKSEIALADFYLTKYSYTSQKGSLDTASRRIEHGLKEYATHLDATQNLNHELKNIVVEPIEAYRTSLQNILVKITDYITSHEKLYEQNDDLR